MSNDTFVKFPKIRHPKDAAKAKARARISGPVPYNATVKLHGTNAAVGKDMEGNIFFQSRNRLITPDDDNQGFARWMSQPDRLAYYEVKLPRGCIVYGEFAGPGIQDKVAISDVPDKFFSSFSIWVQDHFIPVDPTGPLPELGLYGPMYRATNIPIDFSAKEDMTYLEDMTLAVEECCPFAAEHFEMEGIGEGLVWTPSDWDLYVNTDLWFKTKGDKHQKKARSTSYKPRADLSAAQAFFEEAFERRAHQGVAYIVEMYGEATREHTGDFIKWCVMDVLEEEELPSGVDESQVGKVAGGIAAPWYLSEVG